MQQEAQWLRAQEIHINDLLQPYQEQIAEIVDTVEQKVTEFTATRNEIDVVEDSSISQAMLDSAQEHVEAMQNEVAGLRDKLIRLRRKPRQSYSRRSPLVVA